MWTRSAVPISSAIRLQILIEEPTLKEGRQETEGRREPRQRSVGGRGKQMKRARGMGESEEERKTEKATEKRERLK
jgi:hypothetical protein